MEYGSIDELDREDAPRQAKRYAVGVVTATALVALGATSAIRTTTSLRATAQNPVGRRVQVHAFADALWPDCRRHAMSLHDVMLSNDDLLAAVDLTVDFHGNEASVEEHGMVLLDVNRNHLCVQHEADLDQTEWWPTAHCMFGLQACLDNDGSTTCDQAESGSEDDLAMTGGETDLTNCDCSLDGVTSYCLSKHTDVEWSALDKTCDVSRLAKKSSGRAAQADDGATLWVTIDGIKYTYAEGAAYGGTNTEEGFGAWAARVMGVVCQSVQNAGQAVPESCAGYFPPH